MKFGKMFALVLGFVGAIALGVWVGPHMTQRGTAVTSPTASVTPAPKVNVDLPARDVRRSPASRHATTAPITAPTNAAPTTEVARTSSSPTTRTVPAAAPALHEVLKPLLNKGADMGVAAQEFVDAEQFAAVAHASRNTEVPFMVLKHRIVEEGKTLEDAIRELKPTVNARVEARRALSEAKSDISVLQS
jgi:hypothetical protein